jgi:tetratricopeptide (TPR) repeat protein
MADLTLREVSNLLRDLHAPERLRSNPLLRRFLPGAITSRDLKTFRRGIELNLERLPDHERRILLRHDIEHIPANDVRRDLYISPRQFSIERRRALAHLSEYVIGDPPPRSDRSAVRHAGSGAIPQRPIRGKDILQALRPTKGGSVNPVVEILGCLSDDTVYYLSPDVANGSNLRPEARARQIILALVRRLPEKEQQVVLALVNHATMREIASTLKVSPRHTGRLRAQAIAALREAVLDLESRSHAFVASRPAAASAATLALPLARALLQAGAYGSALNAVDDALQRCSDHAERLILNVEAAEIELHAQLIAAAGKRLETTRQLLKTVDMPLAVAGPCTFRIETLEAFLSPDYFVALERCEQAVRSFRSWLLEHGCTRDSAMRVIWALCCISEIARTAGLPSRARSAVVDAEQLVEQWSLQHSWIASHLRLQRSCADVALLGSLAETLQSLSDQFDESSDRGWFANASRIALCMLDFNSSLGRHSDAIGWAKWLADHEDRLSPLDRIVLALNSADALNRSGRPREALRVLSPYMRPSIELDGLPLAPIDVRAAEALVLLGHPREALASALRALKRFDKKRALPNAARAHAVAAQCYVALESTEAALLHLNQSQSLAEKFASPAQLLQVYAVCADVTDDRRLKASVKEMRRAIEASTANVRPLRALVTGPTE